VWRLLQVLLQVLLLPLRVVGWLRRKCWQQSVMCRRLQRDGRERGEGREGRRCLGLHILVTRPRVAAGACCGEDRCERRAAATS
jgi:hypothetical protein